MSKYCFLLTPEKVRALKKNVGPVYQHIDLRVEEMYPFEGRIKELTAEQGWEALNL